MCDKPICYRGPLCSLPLSKQAAQLSSHTTRYIYVPLVPKGLNIIVFHAHPVRGKSHIQRNATGKVATI